MILEEKTSTHLVVKALLPAHRCVAAQEASPQPLVPARDPHPGPTAGARGGAGPQVAVAESPPGPGRFPLRQNPSAQGPKKVGASRRPQPLCSPPAPAPLPRSISRERRAERQARLLPPARASGRLPAASHPHRA